MAADSDRDTRQELDSLRAQVESLKSELARLQAYAVQRAEGSGDPGYLVLAEKKYDAVWQMDRHLKFVYVSASCEKVFGFTAQEIMNLPLDRFIVPEGLTTVRRAMSQRMELEEGQAQDDLTRYWEVECYRKDGGTVWVEVSTTPLRGPHGEFTGLVGTVRDITQRLAHQAALAESEARYRELVEHSQVVVIKLTPQGMIEHINEPGSRLFGLEPGELVDKSGSTLDFLARQARANPQAYHELETEVICRDGRRLWMSWRNQPLWDARGDLAGWVCYGMDATARRRAEQELQRSQAVLTMAGDLSGMGAWDWDLESGVLRLSEAQSRIHGMTKQRVTVEEMRERAHPDDLEMVLAALERAWAGLEPYDLEHRVIRADNGEVRWVHARGEVERNEDGIPRRILGASLDITERKAQEERLRASLAEKEVLLQEIHHRVRNNMQVISSLLLLQAEKITDYQAVEAFRDCQLRVQAMSLIHDSLYQEDSLAVVRLGGYLSRLGQGLLGAYRAKNVDFICQADGLDLDPSSASTLGLVVNELITNSLKHAFPLGQGSISLEASRNGQGQVEVLVTDDGVGLPGGWDWRARAGLGLRLALNLVEHQLGGDLLHLGPPGASFLIRFTPFPA